MMKHRPMNLFTVDLFDLFVWKRLRLEWLNLSWLSCKSSSDCRYPMISIKPRLLMRGHPKRTKLIQTLIFPPSMLFFFTVVNKPTTNRQNTKSSLYMPNLLLSPGPCFGPSIFSAPRWGSGRGRNPAIDCLGRS